MLDLNDLHYFVQVIDHGGLTAATRATGLSKATLSQRIRALEERLGVRLIHRTSRRFVPTEIGRELHRHAVAMLVEAEAAEAAVLERLAEPRGVVRFTCSIAMAEPLSSLLPRFLARHPKVTLVQLATNRAVDIVEEGIDVALRGHIGPLPDTDLVQHLVLDSPWHLFASPAPLTGPPLERPQDLAAHAILMLTARDGPASWTLHGDGGAEVVVALEPRLRSDDISTLKAAAVAGLGIVALPAYLCRREVESGVLRRLLPGWTARKGRITLLTPSRRGLLPSVRAFVDFLVAEYPPLLAP